MRNFNDFPSFPMLTKKRKYGGTMWASFIGLGISALVYGITKGKRNEYKPPLQNIVKTIKPPKADLGMSDLALAEFSDELLANALKNDKKR
ncbi:MAG: hypothetical protein K0Q87_1639 [Neobacillus sp.]|jgi:hypothetical protein|nr:hypothetical protein [Neobacillus sp.]